MAVNYQQYLGRRIIVQIDRPVGSKHPKYDYHYPLNYGYVPKTVAEDGSEIDVYLLNHEQPLSQVQVVIVGIAVRHNDDENKLIATLDGHCPDVYSVTEQLYFQEQYFDTEYVLVTSFKPISKD
ncbi:inorganic pyrophosphatase [Bacterioplanes sanyensis]|uniref:inorganic diphosphatase n=1 Tax=Bacterioplanes sanyensis TaxID=1249553 RepID=A0A222FH04_9GAMM|nr:inorganic diphosphatase [Bacterioplanes sanyensis]ASP38347.1 inorganic pyrophosphatase [Bacterioplanes sanyensis]